MAKAAWLDVSVPLQNGLVRWPGDSPFAARRAISMEDGGGYNSTALSMSAHAGTHVDAPLHFLKHGTSVDRLPLDAVVGPARVIETRGRRAITAAELAPRRIRRGERILFKTRNSQRRWSLQPFNEDFVALTADAARFLATRGVRCVGMDYLSVGDSEAHVALLQADVWIIECLDLFGVAPGRYDLVCLPLRLVGGDGAPARAILRPRRSV